jgi:hypothetical protein
MGDCRRAMYAWAPGLLMATCGLCDEIGKRGVMKVDARCCCKVPVSGYAVSG